jgi:hypothetical protein
MARKSKSKGVMKILVSGRRTNTLQDIQAAVAAAAKKTGGTSKTPARVTVQDMKAGIVRAVQSKHRRH